MKSVRVSSLNREDSDLKLILLNSSATLERPITKKDINRPGLALGGFFDSFDWDRVQLFGRGEWTFLESLSEARQREILEQFFSYPVPLVVFTHEQKPGPLFLSLAGDTPVFTTELTTHNFVLRYSRILDEKLAPSSIIHGVFVEVFGVGVLLQGKSGVGKSEAALELVERGHRLVADDIVEIFCRENSTIIGQGTGPVLHHMEIRGLGIISIPDLFGSGSVRKSKVVELILHLEDWDDTKDYDRIGLDSVKKQLLGVDLDYLEIPVRPGRNLPILIETAAKNYILKKMGRHSTAVFTRAIENAILSKEVNHDFQTGND